MMRVGKVTERDAATARVRVTFTAYDEMVSWWLPVMQPKTLVDQLYWMPDLDEHVVCLLDDRAEFGVVLGSIYSEADPPPVASLEKLHLKFSDDTTLEYDRETHTLAIDCKGPITIAAAGDVSVTADGDASVQAGGSITVEGDGEVSIQSAAAVSVSAPSISLN